MKRINLKSFFDNDPLGFKFEVVVCYNDKQWNDYVLKADEKIYGGEGVLHTSSRGWFIEYKGQGIIILRRPDSSILVHELIHLVMCVFDNRGIPIRRENDEIFAYYFQYYYDIIRKKIKFN